jgi:hypothetical protein
MQLANDVTVDGARLARAGDVVTLEMVTTLKPARRVWIVKSLPVKVYHSRLRNV